MGDSRSVAALAPAPAAWLWLCLWLCTGALAAAPDAVSSRWKWDGGYPMALTFVVDTTTSMGEEINAVKEAIADIFEYITSHFPEDIVYYILVDFNDPDAKLVIKTNKTDEFRIHINNLSLRSPSPPCPEMSMTGLQIALKESPPKSNIFLFTDATARDYEEKGPEVIDLAQRKQSKVLFVLTGKCGDYDKPSFEIYETIARISNGHIFYLQKSEVEQVLKFVQENFGRKDVVSVGHLASAGTSDTIVPVDTSMSKISVTVTGKDPKISFTNPTGKVVEGSTILHLESVLSKTVYSPEPGIWGLSISVNSEGHFIVAAESTFNIVYGFSIKATEKILETAPRPLGGTKNFLLIQVRNNSGSIELSEVKVKDSSHNILLTRSLHPVSSEPGTYKSDVFLPPSSIFFLEVNGRDSKNNSVTRTSESGILVQDAEPPIITSKELTAILKSSFKLMCHVESLIPFNATWYKETDKISSEEHFPQTASFYYLIVNITRASAGKYTCEARNSQGAVRQDVILHVEDAPPTVKTPVVIELLANKSGEIPCEVESDVYFTVSWAKKEVSGTLQSVSGGKYAIASTGNLTLSSVQKSDEGIYQCTATSKAGKGTGEILVQVVETVEVAVASNKREFEAHESLHLSCAASGSPPLTIRWQKGTDTIQDSDSRIRHEDNKLFLDIINATKHDEGIYECEGKNNVNIDKKAVELMYLESPSLNLTTSPSQTLIGNEYTLQCSATGSPKPTILWSKDGTRITSGPSEQVLDNGTLIIHKLSLNHTGFYQCFAENKVGKYIANKSIDVGSIPEFDRKQKDNISIDVLTNGTISCNVSGHPSPQIVWSRVDGKSLSVRFSAGPSCSKHLTDAHPDDEGIYNVTATNKFGNESRQFKIYITGIERPVLADDIGEEPSIAGSPKELPCRVLGGNPPPRATWFKDGELLSTEALALLEASVLPNGSLFLDYVKHEDDGTYECEVANFGGKTRRRVNLLVQDVPYFVDDVYALVKAKLKNSVVLSCKAYGNPIPKIQWMKNGLPLKLSSPFMPGQPGSGLLLITKAEKDINGTFECIASSSAGKSKKIIDLLVQYPPIIHPQSDITPKRGEEVILECRVDAYPVAKIEWRKHGVPLFFETINYSENHSSFRFVADSSTSGVYECIAINEEGQDKIEFTVTATEPPSFANKREFITVTEGEYFTLSCDSGGLPLPDHIWTKYDLSGAIDTTFAPKSWTQREVALSRIQASDKGLYTCKAVNRVGLDVKRFVVIIYVAPYIRTPLPEKEVLRKGSKLERECHANGKPTPEIHWLRNGNPTEYDKGNGLLLIERITRNCTGVYTCVAKNYEGTVHKNMQVLVEEPPVKKHGFASTVEVKRDQTLNLHCPFEGGIPTPVMTWYKDGKKIDSTNRIYLKPKKQLLRINKVQEADSGYYQCRAFNPAGIVDATIYVQVLRAPKFTNKRPEDPINKFIGDTIELDCSSSGEPRPEMLWYKDNHPLTPFTAPYAASLDQKLRIPNSEERDAGEYRCNVQNSATLISRLFMVKLYGGARGAWAHWGAWSPCSVTCGHSERVRRRSCRGPGSSATCDGDAEEWQRCHVPECKVDGGWSRWGEWTECSTTCGSGERIRRRMCDNPLPENGGRSCSGLPEQLQICNSHPCPVHGSWSEWSKWQLCRKCSGGIQTRTRNCASPIPAFGGKPCEGAKVDSKPCPQDGCPVAGGWSHWSEWTPCSATCGPSTKSRERSCDNPAPANNGSLCVGKSRKRQRCVTTPCDNIPLTGSLLLEGMLNGFNISRFVIKEDIEDMDNARQTIVKTKNPFLYTAFGGWFPYLSLVLPPFVWLTAFQKEKGLNGYNLTEGRFKMQSLVTFESGEKVTIIHKGLGAKDKLNLHAEMHGIVPLFPPRSKVEIHPYQEDYVSIGPGELYVSSSSTAQNHWADITYTWKTTRTVNYDAKLKKLLYPTQSLMVETIKSRTIKFEVKGFVSESKTMCPDGFNLTKAGYCQDIDECSNRRLQNCHLTQTCTNTNGSYLCSCPPGFLTSPEGKCLDVDECDIDIHICSHKCVNLEGSFKCLCPPGMALESSKTICSKISGLTHCFNNQTVIDGICYDTDPCKTPSNPCKDNKICLSIGRRYKCVLMSCPADYSTVNDTNSCVKYCNITTCNSIATVSETIIHKMLILRSPIAPFENMMKLTLNMEKHHFAHTFYRIIKNADEKPFRVKVQNEEGTLYSVVNLKGGQELSFTVVATTYDDSHSTMLYYNKFEVKVYITDDF